MAPKAHQPRQEAEAEDEDLGDLSDCPPHHLLEVTSVIRALKARERSGDLGGYTELRDWLGMFARMSGFSGEAAVQICDAIARCLKTKRPPKARPMQQDLQQGFVRMGGVKEVVNTMLLRLSEAKVVAACARTLAATVQGSPLAAEFLHTQGQSLALLLRAIERHASDPGVAESGCVLIVQLVSQLPRAEGDVREARARGHCESQVHLADMGALDLVMDILCTSLRKVKDQVANAEHLQSKVSGSAGGRKDKDSEAKRSVMRVKANMEVREAWATFSNTELINARVQEAAVQALILLAKSNLQVTRMLAGVLWYSEAVHLAVAPKQRTESAGSGDLAGGGKKPNKEKFQLPKGDERRSLSTFEAFTRACIVPVEVLQGRCARDRPALKAKACRLLSLLAAYHLDLLAQVATGAGVQLNKLAVRIRPCGMPKEDRRPEAPFAPLSAAVKALTSALREHPEDVVLLTEALAALGQLRTLALKAAPAGVALGSQECLAAWQKILAGAQEEGELVKAGELLEKALHQSEMGDRRMEYFGLQADDLAGEGCWLTPRVRVFAQEAVSHSVTLNSDAVCVRWKKGDPELRTKRAKEAKSKAERAKAAARSMSPKSDAPSTPQTPLSPGASSVGTAQSGKSKVAAKKKSPLPMMPEQLEWTRALGWDQHDQADFDRLWKKPLLDVLNRTFSTPSMPGAATMPSRPRASEGEEGEDVPAPPRSAPSKAKKPPAFDLKLVSSVPGKLRAQLILQPRDRTHRHVQDMRLQQLVEATNASDRLGTELGKTMRRSGVLLPAYGIQVSMKPTKLAKLEGKAETPEPAAVAAGPTVEVDPESAEAVAGDADPGPEPLEATAEATAVA